MTILNIAHRGASKDAPENTLAAFRLGLEQGCDAFELDVQLTKDGQVMVCHDFTLKRTTGAEGRFIDMEAAAIRELDAGSWFGEQYRGEKVPFLTEVLELVPRGIMINVEIKMIPEYIGRIENAVISVLRETDRISDVVISTFDHPTAVAVKTLEPKLRVGLLYGERLYRSDLYARSMPVPIFSLHPHYYQVNEETVAQAKANGLATYPWTVDDEAHMRRLIGLGVEGIITNVPGKLRQVLQEG